MRGWVLERLQGCNKAGKAKAPSEAMSRLIRYGLASSTMEVSFCKLKRCQGGEGGWGASIVSSEVSRR